MARRQNQIPQTARHKTDLRQQRNLGNNSLVRQTLDPKISPEKKRLGNLSTQNSFRNNHNGFRNSMQDLGNKQGSRNHFRIETMKNPTTEVKSDIFAYDFPGHKKNTLMQFGSTEEILNNKKYADIRIKMGLKKQGQI